MDTSNGLFSDRIPWIWLFILAGALLYIPFIGGVHLFDWDEINFAEISREMIATGDYLRVQVNYQPFFEKPPLFFWLQSMSMHVFAVNEFAARLPNALGGILVLVFLYKIGTHWISKSFGILWALSYLGSILPVLYHKSGIIDPWFNLFIFGSIVAWIEGSKDKKVTKWFLISGILSGLAILTKGPVGPLLIGLTILLIRVFSKEKRFLSVISLFLFLAGNILIAGSWFGIEWLAHGPEFISAFFKYQVELLSESVAGHKGFPGYHFVVALFGIFPASLFAIGGFRKKQIGETVSIWRLRLSMVILTFIVLVLFSIVQSKIVHYSSLAYYPVSFLSAWSISQMLEGRLRWNATQKILSAVVVLIVGLLLFGLPYAGLNLEKFRSTFSLDAFTEASLNAPVVWSYFDFIPALFFFLIIVVSYLLYRKSKIQFSLISLFVGMAMLVNVFLIFFIGKIEHYSQRAPIEFYKSKEGQNVEIKTYGFHSYAPFFYAKKPVPSDNVLEREMFYILKKDKSSLQNELPNAKLMYEKNGFIFLGE